MLPPAPAAALVAPGAGTVSEVQSEYGDARIAGTADGWLAARPADEVIRRTRDGGATTDIATGVHPRLVAWDPSTDDAVFSDAEGRIRRVHGTALSDIATGLQNIRGIDVASDGTVYVAHLVPTGSGQGSESVSAISSSGVRTVVAGGGTCARTCKRAGAPATTAALTYLTGVTVAPNGDVLVFEDFGIDRVSGGVLRRIAGTGEPCGQADPCGDEGPAIDARFAELTAADVGADGSIYVAEHANARIRVVRPDGNVHNLLGSFARCSKVGRFDCLPNSAPTSAIQRPLSLTIYAGDDLLAIDASDDDRWIRLLQVYDVDRVPAVAPQGYRMIAADGGVFTFGWSPYHGSTGAIRLVSPIVAGRSNGANGYRFVAGDGGVFTFGDAEFFGSAAGSTTSPVVDMFASDRGDGYTILERNGTLHEYGSTVRAMQPVDPAPYAAIVWDGIGALRLIAERPSELPPLNVPIVAAHGTRSGNGAWYVASDGGVFTLGDAGFFGSTGAMRLNQPVLDLIPTPTEQGYWLIAADGGVFTFGDATFLGSMGAVRLNQPVVAGVAGPSSSG